MLTKKGVTIIENPNSREPITTGENYLKEIICSSTLFDGWTLYEQPIINSMHPDFILVHREKGILIIEVKDWHLNPPQYLNNAQILGSNGKYFTDNPVKQVTSYKDLISKYELDSYIEVTEHYSSRALGMITPIVYFHNANRQQALEFCNNPDPRKSLIWSQADLIELCTRGNRDDRRFPACLFYESSNFARDRYQSMQKLVDSLEAILRPSDYARGRKDPIKLTKEQNNLVSIKEGSIRRWGGVAGSGKTLIIATKATEAIKEGHRVLILTFNITLRHYIRDLCSQQFGAGNRKLLKSHLTISHFHGFLKILMTELGIQVHKSVIEQYTNQAMDQIINRIRIHHPFHLKYDCILIDEGQDFSGPWIMFLKNFFTSDGEILVMYDRAQSIYEDQGVWITNPSEIEGIGFRGQVGHLSVTHRLPESIIHQIERLNHVFGIENKIEINNSQGDLFTKIQWINVHQFENRYPIIQQKITEILLEGTSTIEDITIITMNENTGIEMVNAFRNMPYAISHVYDLSGQRDQHLRRNEKWKFQPGKGRLKVCSYHSYKGWESSHIILLLEGMQNDKNQLQEIRNALFIALTRVNTFSDSRSFTCINNCREFDGLVQYF